MRSMGIILLLALGVSPLLAQENAAGPADEKAQKSYQQGMSFLDQRNTVAAFESFTKKVVLLDFWATWCGPCREALPHMQAIARKFQGQPLVILSVSLDSDEKKWKEFVAKNGMTWMNCRDGKFDGPMAKLFDVHAIPHTFTIDAYGVLQDEHIGDASTEGKLRKQIARAQEMHAADHAAR